MNNCPRGCLEQPQCTLESAVRCERVPSNSDSGLPLRRLAAVSRAGLAQVLPVLRLGASPELIYP